MAAGGLFSVTIMLLFALLGYIMTRYGFSIVISLLRFSLVHVSRFPLRKAPHL